MAASPSTVQDQRASKIALGIFGQFEALQQDDTLTDFEITCRDRSVKVHSVVLAAHSKFMRVAVSGPFKEAQEKTLDLSVHELADVERLLTFMYTLTYEYAGDPEGPDVDIKMYAMADMYDMDALKQLALDNFRSKIECLDLDLARKNSVAVCETIHAAYEAAAQPLCDLLVSQILAIKVLAQEDLTAERIFGCVDAIPQLGKDIIKAMSKQM